MWPNEKASRGSCGKLATTGTSRNMENANFAEPMYSFPTLRGAHGKLEQLLAAQWSWFVLPNNCASFVEDVVRAGGSTAGLYSNCPSREQFK